MTDLVLIILAATLKFDLKLHFSKLLEGSSHLTLAELAQKLI